MSRCEAAASIAVSFSPLQDSGGFQMVSLLKLAEISEVLIPIIRCARMMLVTTSLGWSPVSISY